MEKCTYCVQRINEARIEAKKARADRPRIATARSSRPASRPARPQAIVFGDINDPEARGGGEGERSRNYGLLTELGTRPRTTYLAKVSNPNPESSTSSEGGDRSMRPLGWPTTDPRERSVSCWARASGVAPGHTLRPRSPTRSLVVETCARDAALVVSSAPSVRRCLVMVSASMASLAKLFFEGVGHLGHEQPGRLGLRDHQLRLVDRHRPRRDADLGHPAAASTAGLADLDQPLRRGDDALRRRLCRIFPLIHVGRPWLAYWLLPYPNTMGLWPQFRSPLIWDVFAVHLRDRLGALLVRRPDPRSRDAARPSAEQGWKQHRLRHASRWDGAARPRHWHNYEIAYLLLAGLADAAGGLGAHGGQLRLRGRPARRLARHDLPALLRRRAPSSPASRWC